MIDSNAKLRSIQMPFCTLLKANCKPDRFDGRDGPVWGQEYSWNLAKDRLQDLEKYGKAYVSRHEDRMGEGFSFGPDLLIIR